MARSIIFMLKHPMRQRRRFQGCREAITASNVMFWWGVSHQGVTTLHFCEKGVKTGAFVNQEDVLQGVAKLLNITFFSVQK